MARPDLSVKVAFVSCKDELIVPYLERLQAIYPELPLYVVAEFSPSVGHWIPFRPSRSNADNLAFIRDELGGACVRLSAVALDPGSPYLRMAWLAFLLRPRGFLVFDDRLQHFVPRPRDGAKILRYCARRCKAFVRGQLSRGGIIYTWAWRVRHPRDLRRPIAYRMALLAGWVARQLRLVLPARPDPTAVQHPDGISVVVPTRNGKDLVSRLLPGLLAQLPTASEVIVVDNGSDDGTGAYLSEYHPSVRVEVSEQALSFAAAVNRGIRAAKYSHVCLLNNDMIVEPDFLAPLRAAFDRVPDLFCSTAQILFPPGMRRQETGKAVWWSKQQGRQDRDFPVRCIEPLAGEDATYVLYGSGGCSMYDARKMEQIGGFDELLVPAYVEDLDIGWRGWMRGWPTVYSDAAKVTHFHRSTTSRYFKPELLQSFVEYNFLRFVARRVWSAEVFRQIWTDAVVRLNLLAVDQLWFVTWALEALSFAWKATRLMQRPPTPLFDEREILALGDGSHAVFPGRPSSGKPRVMVISPYLPFPLSHGGAVRIYNLMRCAAESCDQILVAFVDELIPVPAELTALCVEVVLVKRYATHLLPDRGRPDVVEEYASLQMDAVLRMMIRKWQPNVAQLEFTQMAVYAASCKPLKTILVEHDITYDLQQQMLQTREDWETRRQFERWFRFEKQAWNDMDRVVVMSEKDRAAVGNAKAVCVPNGVDLERFRAPGKDPEAGRILFIGSFAHLPNVLALDFFLRECWLLLGDIRPTLHIIAGSRPEYFLERHRVSVPLNLQQPGIELEAFVADVRPAYERAAVVIAPLIASAGTNIKVMEAMAMGKAVVSTAAGINGLDLTDGKDVIVAESGAAMAAAIRHLMQHPEARKALEHEARKTVEREFDWHAIAERQAEMYRQLTDATPPK